MVYHGDGWMWRHGWGWGDWILMSGMTAAFLVACVVAMVLAVRYLTASRQAPGRPAEYARFHSECPLAAGFAHGEIDEEEYCRRMTVPREHR
ncbi:hypothetical protein VIMS_00519 [Mycobacterium marinum]|nr:hypothetical protein VIMS_00519 [Mycobacterium marinum]